MSVSAKAGSLAEANLVVKYAILNSAVAYYVYYLIRVIRCAMSSEIITMKVEEAMVKAVNITARKIKNTASKVTKYVHNLMNILSIVIMNKW